MSSGGKSRKSERSAEPREPTIPLPPPPTLRSYLFVFLWCAGVTVLLHCSMLFKPHSEGDELAYFALSERMGWDLSNYTTKDDSRVNTFPYTIYRNPVFHHPPLLPLVLKAGAHFTANPLLQFSRTVPPRSRGGATADYVAAAPVAAAFLFNVAVCVAALWYVCRLLVLCEIGPSYGAAALVGITLCPLLLFSTVRIHHDGLAGLLLLCGFIAFAESLERRAIVPALEAAFWLVAAMNVRFNAIAALPLLLFMPVYAYARRRSPALKNTAEARAGTAHSRPHSTKQQPIWLAPAIVFGALFTLGMQHYYRLIATYGTLWPGAFVQPIGDVARFSPFLAIVEKMTRSWVAWELVAIFPFAVLFAAPWVFRHYWSDLQARKWPAYFVLVFAFLFVTQLGIAYKQVRYFAAVTPFMHVCWPYLLRLSPLREWIKWSVWGLGGVTLLLMVTTGFLNATMHDPDQTLILPSITIYWPSLLDAYRQSR
jgi:hypothetical protein